MLFRDGVRRSHQAVNADAPTGFGQRTAKRRRDTRSGVAALIGAVLLAPALALAQGGPNYRWVNFYGQTVPTAYPATLTSNGGESTLVIAAPDPGIIFYQGFNETVTPAPFLGANLNQAYVEYRNDSAGMYTYTLGSQVVAQDFLIGDQAVRTTTYLSGKCMNAAGTALEPCDFSQVATYNEYQPTWAPYCGRILTSWNAGTHELMAYTPWDRCNGDSTQGIKLYIKLPASLREISARNVNGLGVDSNIRALAVADAPHVTKAFAPASVKTGEVSTLTINLNNTIVPAAKVPNVNLTDVLPAPLELVAVPTTTCTGGTLTGAAGTNTIKLTGATLPEAGCTITAQVRWPATSAGVAACKPGTPLVNTITPPAQFSTPYGQLEKPATANLACGGVTPVAGTHSVPTQSPGMLALLVAACGLLGWRVRRHLPR